MTVFLYKFFYLPFRCMIRNINGDSPIFFDMKGYRLPPSFTPDQLKVKKIIHLFSWLHLTLKEFLPDKPRISDHLHVSSSSALSSFHHFGGVCSLFLALLIKILFFRTKFYSSWAQTSRPFPQHHGCQSPILSYDNISDLCYINDLYISFLGVAPTTMG